MCNCNILFLQSNNSANEVFENKMSDVVKGKAWPRESKVSEQAEGTTEAVTASSSSSSVAATAATVADTQANHAKSVATPVNCSSTHVLK